MIRKKLAACAILALSTSVGWSLTYNGNVTAGVYYGSGNNNGAWTIDSSNSIELGLRTHQRFPSAANTFNHTGSGVYSWADQLGYIGSWWMPPNPASWNYDFSIDVSGTGKVLSDFVFQLWVDSDPGAGQSWTFFNPMLIPDNARPGVPYGPTSLSSAYAQNSENPRFAIVGIPGYNNAIAGTYDFSLRALDSNGALLANTYMRVNVNNGTAQGAFNGNVPDSGATVALVGFALAGLVGLRRRFAR